MEHWRRLYQTPLVSFFLLFSFLLFSAAAHSENFRVDVSASHVIVANEDYDDGFSSDANISYFLKGVLFSVGVLNVWELRPEDEDGDRDTDITVAGVYLGIAKEIDVSVLKIELGGGGIYANTAAEFRGREVADDNNFSPYINLKLVKDFGPIFSLQGGWKYIDDLSGGDLHFFQAGVRFSF